MHQITNSHASSTPCPSLSGQSTLAQACYLSYVWMKTLVWWPSRASSSLSSGAISRKIINSLHLQTWSKPTKNKMKDRRQGTNREHSGSLLAKSKAFSRASKLLRKVKGVLSPVGAKACRGHAQLMLAQTLKTRGTWKARLTFNSKKVIQQTISLRAHSTLRERIKWWKRNVRCRWHSEVVKKSHQFQSSYQKAL